LIKSLHHVLNNFRQAAVQ